MSDTTGRIFGALAALAALWVIVYWWWEPSRPKISLDATAPASAGTISFDPGPPPAARPTADAPPIITAPSHIAVIPPRFRDYTIRKGDTFESIAQQEMGSRKYADALRSANALMDPQHPKPGRTLRIPLDPTNIQGKPVAEAPPAAPAASLTTPAPDSQATEYTVKSGDSLSAIAKAHYGSTRFKDLIYEANKDRLASEDDLREGQKLRLPPKPK